MKTPACSRHADHLSNWRVPFLLLRGDGVEPPHVHVEWDANRAKFWLEPVRLQQSGGFGRAELSRISTLLEGNHEHLLKAWNDFFGH